MQIEGKTALITGSGRGIGKAVALKLSQMGANIVLNARESSNSIDRTAQELKGGGHSVLIAKGDVRDEKDVKAIIKKAIDTYGNIHILVNNAGITKDGPIAMMSEGDWDDVLDINLKGAFLCTKAVSRIMIKQRYGKIVNITSIAGIMGNSGQANYSASKAGLIGLTKSTAKELASRHITCNAVAPGLIISKMSGVLPEKIKESYMKSIPLGRFGTPEEVANVVGFLASPQSDYITGQVINIDGGMVM